MIDGVVVRLNEDELARLRSSEAAGTSWLADHPDAYELEDALLGVHVLLTGLPQGGDGPLSFLANPAFGEPRPGLGRIVDPAAVVSIADAIESMSVKHVRARLASDTLRAVYPFSGRALTDEDQEWLLAVLQGLMTFVRGAATDGVPLLITRG